MCCLKYEHPFYTEFARTAPAVAKLVTMEDGDGVFVGHQAPADSVVIRMHANGDAVLFPLPAACGARQLYASRTTAAQEPRLPCKGRIRRRRSNDDEN